VPSIVKAGERGVDFSFAKPPAARLVELGYTFVVGYISIAPASPGKNISQAECEAYLAAGLKVLLVWEMSATRPNLGASVGALDGRNASFQAAIRGYPDDVPILAAVDTNSTPTNISAHAGYLEAFAANCGPYLIGVYGDTDILTRCSGLWRIGWVPNAWSWSGSSRANAEAKARTLGAHVLQRTGFHIDDKWAVDPNDAIADFPAWGTATEPPPPDEEDDVLEYVLIPTHPDAEPWWPWLACYSSGTVRPLGPGPAAVPQHNVTDIGQYRRICAAAGIQLEVEFPACLDEQALTVAVEAPPIQWPTYTVEASSVAYRPTVT
jgi:hypothetical protein